VNSTSQLGLSRAAESNRLARAGGALSDALTEGERSLRWFIVGWLTVSTILNLIDKQTLGIIAPFLPEHFGMTEKAYSRIVMAYQLPYAIMYVVGGRFVDLVGEKIGMTACILWWSVSTMLCSLARGVFSFGALRFLLGVGEPANYPAALRASARWFAREERGLPISIWSSGSSVGSLIAFPMVAFLARKFGWQAAFVVPGSLGLLWVLVWVLCYRKPSFAVESLASLPPHPGPLPRGEGESVSAKVAPIG